MKQNEKGRSALELLSVLVVVILIALGGLHLWNEAKFDAKSRSIGERLLAVKNSRFLSMNSHSNERLSRTENGPYDSVLSIENGIGPQNKDWFWITVKTSNSSLCTFLTEYDIDAGFVNDDCETSNEVTFYFLKFPENASSDTPNKDNQPQECPENMICNDNFEPIGCKENYFLHNGNCTQCPENNSICENDTFECKDGYYKNGINCISCGANVLSCDEDGNPTECEEGYYLSDNTCVACPSPSNCRISLDTTDANGCIIKAQACSSGVCKTDGTCATTCNSGEYNSNGYCCSIGQKYENGICTSCTSGEGCGCSKGTWDGEKCFSCPENSSTTVREGYQIDATQCYCNEGFYYNSESLLCEQNLCPKNSSPILRCDNIEWLKEYCSIDNTTYKYYKSPKDGCFCKENYVVQTLITGIELEDEFCELYQCYEPSSSWSRSDLVSAQARLNNSGSSNWCQIYSEALGNTGVDGISRDGNVRYYGHTYKLESPIVLGNFNGLDFYIRPEREAGEGVTWMGAYTYCQATGGRMVSLNDLIAVGLCPKDTKLYQNCTPLNNIFAAQASLFYWLDDDCKTSVDGSTYYGVECESNPSSNSYYGLCYASSNGYINSQMRIGTGWDIRNTALCVKETSHITCNRENYELDINGNCNCKSGYASGDSNGICLKKCENNSQCAQNEYCQISSWTTGASDDNYFTNISGFCRDKGELPASKTIEGIETWNFGKVNWWNANNLCQAHGKRLFTIEELQCYVPNSSTQINSENVSEQYCCQSNKSCGQTTNTDTFSPIANGIVSQYKIYPWILSSSDNQVSKKSLYMYYQNRYVWDSSTSSYSTDKYQYYKKLNYMDRNIGSYVGGYALCRD